LDPKVSAQDLTLVCTGEWTHQSPEVNKDRPYSRVTGGEISDFLGESTLGGMSAQDLKLLKPEDSK
jgi:hypothetical protein